MMISISALEVDCHLLADVERHYEINFGIWVGIMIYDRLVSEALLQM